MTLEEANLNAVMAAYEVFDPTNLDRVLETFDSDIVWQSVATQGVPWQGTWRGKPGVVEFFQTITRDFAYEEFVPEKFFAKDDEVMVWGRAKLRRHDGGGSFATEFAQRLRLKDGKIVEFREIYETEPIVSAVKGG